MLLYDNSMKLHRLKVLIKIIPKISFYPDLRDEVIEKRFVLLTFVGEERSIRRAKVRKEIKILCRLVSRECTCRYIPFQRFYFYFECLEIDGVIFQRLKIRGEGERIFFRRWKIYRNKKIKKKKNKKNKIKKKIVDHSAFTRCKNYLRLRGEYTAIFSLQKTKIIV